MAKKTIQIPNGNGTDFNIEKSNTSYVLGQNKVMTSGTIQADPADDIDKIVLTINGLITGPATGVEIGADSSRGNKITVGRSGMIDADDEGIIARGDRTTISNDGTIFATDPDFSIGIRSIGDRARIVNDGFMKANTGIDVEGDGNVVINSGFFSSNGGSTGIEFHSETGDSNRFVNTGTLGGSKAVEGDFGNEIVINKGKMDGSVVLGDGDDVLLTYHYVGGDVSMGNGDDRVVLKGKGDLVSLNTGAGDDVLDLRVGDELGTSTTITGGTDDDVYLVSRTDLLLVEFMGGGTDTIKSTVTYTLESNFENLTLIGSKAINGNGNGGANVLTGNAANNRLDGLAGIDTLEGGAGKDVLTGGTSADVFVFERGYGKDTITDFGNGSDTIDLSGYKGINSFDDLDGRIEQAGADAVITLSTGDRIRLENFDAGNLSDTQFHF